MRKVTIVFLVLAVLGSTYGQSGRVKQSTKKATVAPVPVETPSPAEPEKPKKPAMPKMVDGERIYFGREVDESAIIFKKPPPASTRKPGATVFTARRCCRQFSPPTGK